MAEFEKFKRILKQNWILYPYLWLFFQFSKVYGKNHRWIIRWKTSYSTLETCHEQIDTRFEFYSLDLVRDKVIWCHSREFKIFRFTLVQYLYRHSTFLCFSGARKYQNRIRRKILGGDMGCSQESMKTPSWSKSRKTPSLCKSAKWSPYELNLNYYLLII